MRLFLSETLSREKALLELVQLVGRDGLSEKDKWTLNLSELFRLVYLQQNAFDSIDAYCSLAKMKGLLEALEALDILVSNRLEQGVLYDQFSDLPLRAGLLKLRGTPDADFTERASRWFEETKLNMERIEVVVR